MYLISQLWSYLALAFLLGALLGYLLWRWCGRPRIESQYERQRKDLISRLGLLEEERNKFTGAATQAEAENGKLRAELARIRASAGDASSKSLLFQEADEKLKTELAGVRQRVSGLSGDAEKHQREAADAHKALDAEKAAAKDREEKLIAALATAKRAADEAARKHNDELKKAQEHAAAEAIKKHTDDVSRTRGELAARYAEELKKAHETSKQHEAKVQSLMQADTHAKKAIEDVKVHHASELKKAQEHATSEAAKKLADELAKARAAADEAARRNADEGKKAREAALTEAHAKHVQDLKAAREAAAAEADRHHAEELKKAHDIAKQHEAKVLLLTQADAGAKQEIEEAKTRHAVELKKVQEHAAAEAAKKHADQMAKARATADEALRRNTDEGKNARETALTEAHAKHIQDLKAAREAATAEAAKRHAEELSRLKREGETTAARHAEELKTARHAASTAVSAAALQIAAASKSEAKPTLASSHSPAHVSAPKGGKADDLKLIWGVGADIEKLLNTHGIYHFDQMAHWNDNDVAWFDALLPEFHGRAVREKWVEQAKKLASGWRPEREIGDKPTDLLTGPRGGKADDLKLIWGVGPKIEVMLNKAGIYHFAQIASWTGRELEWVDSQLGDFAGKAVREKWIEQCKKLASGWRPSSDVGDKPE